MSPVNNEPDLLEDQVLEDEHQTALQELREREEIVIAPVEHADQ
jgi:hypothetical protein